METGPWITVQLIGFQLIIYKFNGNSASMANFKWELMMVDVLTKCCAKVY